MNIFKMTRLAIAVILFCSMRTILSNVAVQEARQSMRSNSCRSVYDGTQFKECCGGKWYAFYKLTCALFPSAIVSWNLYYDYVMPSYGEMLLFQHMYVIVVFGFVNPDQITIKTIGVLRIIAYINTEVRLIWRQRKGGWWQTLRRIVAGEFIHVRTLEDKILVYLVGHHYWSLSISSLFVNCFKMFVVTPIFWKLWNNFS